MMDVHCPQCQTVFEFDERLMRAPQATLQCSVCDHVFSIESSAQRRQENHLRWMLRTQERGDILYFDGFDTLHRWIIERKVQAQDELSRTGEHWTRLEDVGEFVPIFKVVQSISEMMRGHEEEAPTRDATQQLFAQTAAPSSPPEQPLIEAPTQRTRLVTAPEEKTEVSIKPQAVPASGGELWTLGESSPAEEATRVMPRQEVEPAPGWGRRLLLGALVLAIGAGAYAWTQHPELFAGLTQQEPQPPSVVAQAPDAPDVPAPTGPPSQDGLQEALERGRTRVHEARAAGLGGAEALGVTSAVVAAQAQTHGAAAQALDAQSRAMSRDINVVLKRANSARKRQKAGLARKLYHQALEIDPTNTRAIVGLGWSLMSLGRSGAAAAQFRKALHIDTGVEDAYIGLGKAERARGQLKEALQAYERYLKRYPTGKKASIARYQRDQLKQTLGQ